MDQLDWFYRVAMGAACVALLPVLLMVLLPLLVLAPLLIALLLPVAVISATCGATGVRSELTVSGVRSARVP